jgi:phage/conjugal plasmid C-4 type zinc finger TraR family protein
MDDADYAQIRIDEEIKSGIARVQARTLGGGSRDGVCVDCGEEIPLARLEAAPWAIRCVECETIKEGQRGKGTKAQSEEKQ